MFPYSEIYFFLIFLKKDFDNCKQCDFLVI